MRKDFIYFESGHIIVKKMLSSKQLTHKMFQIIRPYTGRNVNIPFVSGRRNPKYEFLDNKFYLESTK